MFARADQWVLNRGELRELVAAARTAHGQGVRAFLGARASTKLVSGMALAATLAFLEERHVHLLNTKLRSEVETLNEADASFFVLTPDLKKYLGKLNRIRARASSNQDLRRYVIAEGLDEAGAQDARQALTMLLDALRSLSDDEVVVLRVQSPDLAKPPR